MSRPGTTGNTGAQRTSPNKFPFTPYDHPQPQERRSGVRTVTTRSQSISGVPRQDASETTHPFPSSLSPVKNLQVGHQLLGDGDGTLTFPIHRPT